MNEMARPGAFDEAHPIRRDPVTTAAASLVAVLATIVGLILLAWTVLYVTKGRFLKHSFEKYASRAALRDVRVAGDFQLYFNPIDIKFLAEGLTITNPAWAKQPYFLKSKLIDSDIKTIPLIFGRQRADWLMLLGGNLDLEWSADGKQNSWTLGKPTGKPLELPDIRRALILGTRIRYSDPRMQLSANIGIDTVRAQDTRFASDIRFSGDGSLRDRPFTLSGSLLSPNETVTGGQNRFRMHAEAARTVLDVSGTLPGATRIEGVPLDFRVHGYNLANLFDFIGVAVPDTRAYNLRSVLTKQDGEWRFTRLRGRFGDSDLAGRLTVALKDRLKLDAELSTQSLDMIDAGPFVGYDPERLDANGGKVVRTEGGTPRILPDAPLKVDAIRGFDADVHWTVRRIAGDKWPISNIDLTLDLDHSLLKLSPLTFDLDRGHVASDVSIDARRKPVFTNLDLRLSPTPMGRLLKGFGVEEAGTTGTLKARARLAGPGDSIRQWLGNSDGRIAIIMPQGSLWARNVQLSELDIGTFIWKMWEKKLKEPVEINCGLIAFTVRNGIAAADPILIDTKKNVILGRGGFSFKNEALDLRIRADGKRFSLFSGQSPVGIGGYFAAPSLDVISPQLIARGGAGLGLGAVVSPLASVLAFVDIGDAKSAACGPVLAGAHASAQRTRGGEPRDDVGNGTTAKSKSGKRSPEERQKQRKKFLGIF
ncbi:AsmA family protein [Sphingomonas sp. MAH-20]|uniref:AsmA family protein n=1 Tax=Sphingomonas horti TaxID=2682842 RepID=A0A6I4J301_9SPHN|nr:MULTISPECIES: AsmA family protein [Sphingomonas]MBA2919050.1 AsmA family protein [Sphingomonas sp. CGMCC 1.13658]MVO79082.1 AsmA family protein [Sphingomonas horti]